LDVQSPLLPGNKACVLGLAYNDIQNTRVEDSVVAFSKYDDLVVLSPAGKELWKSDRKYGGSELYSLMESEGGHEENRQWLPLRILATDIDDNGTVEVVSINNTDIMGRAISRQRKYTEGLVEGLSWDGARLVSTWKSRKIEGQISDLGIGDLDNDGRPELVLSVITNQGLIIGTDPSSSVIAYDLK
jgi:hypothetical protein